MVQDGSNQKFQKEILSYIFRIWDRIMNTEHPEYVKKYDEIQQRRFCKITKSEV